MNKKKYFPREIIFQKFQEIISSFFSQGSYDLLITDEEKIYSRLNSESKSELYGNFFYSLFLISIYTQIDKFTQLSQKLINSLRNRKQIRKEILDRFSKGVLDVEEYV